MADSNEESLLLVFKESGVEFVKDAGKAVGDLSDQFKDVDKTTKQAVEVLKETSTVSQQLKDKIRDLEGELDKLKDAFRAGLIESESAFLERATDFERGIARHQKALELLEGEGGEEDGKGGFKGAASAAIKAEKAIGKLASGAGLNSLPSLLEAVTGALGMAGGAGMAVGGLVLAFESIIPKIVNFIEKMDGAAAAAKRAADQIAAAHEQMAKFIAQPTEEDEAGAKAVKPLLAGQRATKIAQGIENVLRQQGVGLMEPGERAISETFVGPEATAEAERKQQDQAVAIQRAAIMRDLMAGRTPAISQVSGMAGQFPGLFPTGTEQRFRQALPENLEAARRQAQQAEEQSREADQEYARREAARKETAGIQEQFDKALRDKRTKEAADRDRVAADAEAGRLADERKAETLRRQADAKATRDARENTPEAFEHRARAAEQNEEMGMARQVQAARAGAGDVLASQMGPQELQQVVAQVGRNRTMNSSLGFTLAQQVDYYMSLLENKMVADFNRGMGQQNRTGQNISPFGGL